MPVGPLNKECQRVKRQRILLTTLVALCFCVNVKAEGLYSPSAYEVVFNLEKDSMNAGKMVMSLSRSEDTWHASSVYKPSLVAKLFGLKQSIESTKFTHQNGQAQIREYHINIGDQTNTTFFNLKDNTYNNHQVIPTNAQTNQTILGTLSQDILQKKTQSSYFIFSKTKFKTYQITYQYDQKITINDTEVDTVKTIIKKGKRTTTFWLAKKWNWAPVQFEKHKNDKAIIKGTFKKIVFKTG